jgi:hypothetical protein
MDSGFEGHRQEEGDEDHEDQAPEAEEHIDRRRGEEQDSRYYEGASPENAVVEMLVALVHRQAG